MIENKHVQKAEDEYEYLTGDAAKRRIAYLRDKKIRDEVSGLKMATKLGQEEKQKEIAKKLKEMNVGIDIIIESTGLTEEEIRNL